VAQYEALVDALPAQYQSYARGPQKRQFVESIVQLKVLSQNAMKAGLDKNPKLQENAQVPAREHAGSDDVRKPSAEALRLTMPRFRATTTRIR